MRIKWFSLVRLSGLLLVLLYHFFQTRFPGGFIGVDLFFTFSGYLVTALFIDEYARNGQLDLIGFARRRIYRIVPPLVLMVLVTIPLTFLVKRDFVAGIGYQIAAALGFTTNIYEILTGGNYESQFIPHLFLHTWSLAIEVQFYVFWAIVMGLLAKRHLKPNGFRGLVFVVSAGLFLVSFASMFIRGFLTTEFSQLYFSSLSRSFPFFLGSMFAAMTGIASTTRRFKTNVRLWKLPQVLAYILGTMVMLWLLAFLLEFNHMVTYLFGFVLSSFFSALLIYSVRVLHDKTADLEEPAWLSYLSDLSYGIYLFHWPFYIILSQLMPQLAAVAVTMVLSIGFAILSFSILEPWLAGKVARPFGIDLPRPERKWPLWAAFGGLVALMVTVAGTAPRMGEFEQNLLVNSLQQANSTMNRTHTLAAGDADAISDVAIIGDSVTLRASSAIGQALPEAQVDAAVSRGFDVAYDIYSHQIATQTLPKTIVIAVGVNSVYNYKSDIDRFIEALPAGHRMILVTPYNIKDGRVPAVRDYELAMAEQHDFITIADWYKVASETPQIWAGTDGVHFSDATTLGSELYAKTIKEAVAKAAKNPAK